MDALRAALRRYVTPPDLRDAACATHPEVDWFSEDPAMRDRARCICLRCPELGPCREWALDHMTGSEVGILAAWSVNERRIMRRLQKRGGQQDQQELSA